MAYESVDCVDAGTEYCPCYLAETNNCIICSQLQGKLFCDCINWKGVCIYQEYVWNGNMRKDVRDNLKAQIVESKLVNDGVIFLKIKVTRTLARELNQPGSYIFIRDENYPEFFDVPMSVMYSDEVSETVDLLVQIRGTKTRVLKDIGSHLIIRGPYWNGILGLKNLKKVQNSKCLVIARGIAQAPSVLTAKKLRLSGNETYVILDKGSANTNYSQSYMERLGCTVTELNLLDGKAFREEAWLFLSNIIRKNEISLVFSAGSDLIHKKIIDIIKDCPGDILFSCTNNASICCGEGVCGSCVTRLKDGKKIRPCKAQIDPVYILGGM